MTIGCKWGLCVGAAITKAMGLDPISRFQTAWGQTMDGYGINVVIVKERNESRLRQDDVPVESILKPVDATTAHLAHLGTKKPATFEGRRRA